MEEKKNSMFKRMLEKMMAQYRPTKSGQLRMTFDGTIVLKKTNPTGESYIGINNDGAIVSYEPEFVMDFPVYLIDRPYSQVSENDIMLVSEGEKAMYGKITKVTKDYIEVLCFNGNNLRINKTKDFMTNSETVCVVLNMFAGFNNNTVNGFNPLMFAFMNGEGGDVDMEKFMMLNMMMNQNGNQTNGIDPNMMMLMFLNKSKGESNMFETMMLMQMMQNGGFKMFNTTPTVTLANATPVKKTSTKKTSAKTIESNTDNSEQAQGKN